MDMSKAALPPIHGRVDPEDTKHPRYPAYRAYRSGMTCLMVEAAGFKDWLRNMERDEEHDRIAQHPRFREWQNWMRDHRKGRFTTLPNGQPNAFPAGFFYWLENGAW